MAVILSWCALAAGLLFAGISSGLVDISEGCAPNFLAGPDRCRGVLCGFIEVVAPAALPRRPCYALDLAFFVGFPMLLAITTPLSSRHGYHRFLSPRRRHRLRDATPGKASAPAPGRSPDPSGQRPPARPWWRRLTRRRRFDPRRLGTR